jgi:hypothetical protein
MAYDPIARDHLEWFGYVQPEGLVVSLPALLDTGAAINRNFIPLHRRFLEVLPLDRDGKPVSQLRSFPELAAKVLGWERELLYGAPGSASVPEDLSAPLPDYGETLKPTYALRDIGANAGWLLLVQQVESNFDEERVTDSRRWQASPQARFERLLRETSVPIGVLVSTDALRLVYAPRGESSGHITFRFADMATVAGRTILAALEMPARQRASVQPWRVPAAAGASCE